MAKTILVVDDDAQLVEMVQMRLEAAGYGVITAFDGAQALERVRNEKPDAIILDLMLPHLNGYDVCAALKQDPRYRHIPILIFTAKTQAKDEALAMDCGADGYLRKPFRAEEMLSILEKLLAASTQSPGA